jgi:hypothetical protein
MKSFLFTFGWVHYRYRWCCSMVYNLLPTIVCSKQQCFPSAAIQQVYHREPALNPIFIILITSRVQIVNRSKYYLNILRQVFTFFYESINGSIFEVHKLERKKWPYEKNELDRHGGLNVQKYFAWHLYFLLCSAVDLKMAENILTDGN